MQLLPALVGVLSLQCSEAVSSWNTGVSNVLLQGGGKSARPFIAASSAASNRVLQVRSIESSVDDGLEGTFVAPTGAAGTDFKCRYAHESMPSIFMDTTGAFVDRTTVRCPLPEWGLLHAAATV